MGYLRTRPVSEDKIVDSYMQTHSANKTASVLGIGAKLVYRVLAEQGIKPDGIAVYRKGAARFDETTSVEIRAKYDSGMTVMALSEENGCSFDSIKTAIRNAGGSMRTVPALRLGDGELERIRSMYASGLSQDKIGVSIGRSQAFVCRVMRESGIATRPKAQGERHGSWKGGRWMRADGYWCTKVDRSDPMASMRDRAGYVLEHRLAVARSIGRPLARHETVHHIDGDRENNALSNLQLRQGRHGKGVVMKCRDCGSCNIESTKIAED